MLQANEITIGIKFLSEGKHKKECVVVDILKTYNMAGDLVKTRYVSEHDFLGQKVRNYDVCAITIQKGYLK